MRRVMLLAGLVSALLLQPAVARASWVSDNCSPDHYDDPIVKRIDARAYALVAAQEGYEYGGGCWNDNNKDDTPDQPDSNGEGPDCSGLVFKSWELKATSGQSGGEHWSQYENVHGPYASYAFHAASSSDPFFDLPDKRRSTTIYMDAFAKNGHVALLWDNSGNSDGTDDFIEARGDADGTGIFAENYRSDSAYVAVRREGWTPDCYPQCKSEGSALVVLP